MIYIAIFISKIIENTLATLRLIVVSNGKKKLGAILQGLVALMWILVTGVVIVDIDKDILKIIAFCLGSICGSYFGSVLEETIGLGMVCLKIKSLKYKEIAKGLKNYQVDINKSGLSMVIKRKKIKHVIKTISGIDKSCDIIGIRIKKYDR